MYVLEINGTPTWVSKIRIQIEIKEKVRWLFDNFLLIWIGIELYYHGLIHLSLLELLPS
jgi:hypothetical protein